jgi:thiamine-phosphate pyrophosphorylase
MSRFVDLRLIVITDARLAEPRSIEEVVRAALEAGAPAVQLRDKTADSRSLYEQAARLRATTREFGALLFVNDRLDVALAAGADGAHIGPDDMPLQAARRAAPKSFLIGTSTDDPRQAKLAEAAGASYIGCGAVFGTTSKDVSGEQIGTDGLRAVVESVRIPVVAIGGIDLDNVHQVAETGAAGVAVIRAIMATDHVARTVTSLLSAF